MNKDLRGIEIKVGDRIVYGKSNRDNPIKLGKVISINEDFIEVLGDGNKKTGNIKNYWNNRILILPKDY